MLLVDLRDQQSARFIHGASGNFHQVGPKLLSSLEIDAMFTGGAEFPVNLPESYAGAKA